LRKQKEFLFLFSSEHVIQRFSKYLNKTTLEILSKLKYYNDDEPIIDVCDVRQLQTKFKIPIFFGNECRFVDFCERYKDAEFLHKKTNRIIIIDIRGIGMSREFLWNVIGQKYKCPFLLINANHDYVKYHQVIILCNIITCGLYESDKNYLDIKSSALLKKFKGENSWPNFLTKGQYDPRLFIFVCWFLAMHNDYI
jgi:hypothetical protein